MEFRKCLSHAARKGLIAACCFVLLSRLAAQDFQLAPPQIHCESRFFSGETEAKLAFDLEGASIRYTLDGTAPNKQSPVYQKPISIRQNTHLRCIATHPDFFDSDPAEADFTVVNKKLKADRMTCNPAPNKKYPGAGVATLFDFKAGAASFGGGGWLGFDNGPLVLNLFWKKARKISGLLLSGCYDANAWIFPPKQIRVKVSRDGKNWDLIGEKNFPSMTEATKGAAFFLEELTLNNPKCKYMEIEVTPYGLLPDWHPGKGNPAWLFLDEIILK